MQSESTHITTTPNKVDESNASDTFIRSTTETPERDEEKRKLVNLYENRIEEMHRRHVDELQNLKQKHNDKVISQKKYIYTYILNIYHVQSILIRKDGLKKYDSLRIINQKKDKKIFTYKILFLLKIFSLFFKVNSDYNCRFLID